MAALMFAAVAVFVFEFAKRDRAANRRKCLCGHKKAGPPGGHVQFRDWDSNAWIAGAEYNPGQCRECRCKTFVDDWRQDDKR